MSINNTLEVVPILHQVTHSDGCLVNAVTRIRVRVRTRNSVNARWVTMRHSDRPRNEQNTAQTIGKHTMDPTP